MKRLLGKDFKLTKVQTEANKNPVVALTLLEFEKLVTEAAFAGNELAKEWTRACVGLTITQLAHDAFCIHHEIEERKSWIKAREQHKQQFHPLLTRWMKADGVEGKGYGKAVNLFKAHAGVPLSYVGDYSADDLLKLNTAEIRYDVLRNVGFTHEAAIKQLR